jgi:hypothetical protein
MCTFFPDQHVCSANRSQVSVRGPVLAAARNRHGRLALQIESPDEPVLIPSPETRCEFFWNRRHDWFPRGSLNIAQYCIDRCKSRHVHTVTARTGYFLRMDRAGLIDNRKAVQSIADYPGRGARIARGPVTNRLFAKARKGVKWDDPVMAFRTLLDGRHKGDFIRPSPSGHAPALTAEISIILYHLAPQVPSRFAFGHHF